MSRKIISILAIATVSMRIGNVGSVAFFVNKFLFNNNHIIDRTQLIQIIITLKKSIFSTLREIAYAANCLKIIESGIEARKIRDIIMDDGGNCFVN
jgi:hypothetical protein